MGRPELSPDDSRHPVVADDFDIAISAFDPSGAAGAASSSSRRLWWLVRSGSGGGFTMTSASKKRARSGSDGSSCRKATGRGAG